MSVVKQENDTSSLKAPAPSVTDSGKYVATASGFTNIVTADGSSGFKAERDRYHLYVSLACPFASRTLIIRKLKGLDDVITCTVCDWFKEQDKSWQFTDKKPKCTLDINDCAYLREVYAMSDPGYSGRITVPMLWDKQTKKIVNNESAQIFRMLNKEFNEFCPTEEQQKLDLSPVELLDQIDELNSWIQPKINSGVYFAGFAQSQEAYDEAVHEVFKALDRVEDILSKQRYLIGNRFTEADVKLFTTLVRFDLVYHGHFKCNKKRIIDMPNTWAYVRDIYQMKYIRDTVDFEHITKHYPTSHRFINPYGIVPIGPDLDFDAPHGRESFGTDS